MLRRRYSYVALSRVPALESCDYESPATPADHNAIGIFRGGGAAAAMIDNDRWQSDID